MVHTLRLDNYFPTPRKLVLGTNSSFGTESIKIERGAGWDGLNLTATWHIPGREEPLRVALLDGDAMDVPPEVTKEAKDGVLVLAGLASGVQRASCNVEYLILEQAGVYGGADAEPTPELAAQVLEAALQAKADAEAAAEDAAAAKANADKAQQAAENAAADAAKAGPYAEAARAAQEAAEAARDEAIAAQRAAENAAAAAAENAAAAAAAKAEAVKAQGAAQTAAKSAAAAKTSEDAAAKSAADADSTANSIKDSMTQVAANKEAVSQLKEDIDAIRFFEKSTQLFDRGKCDIGFIDVDGKVYTGGSYDNYCYTSLIDVSGYNGRTIKFSYNTNPSGSNTLTAATARIVTAFDSGKIVIGSAGAKDVFDYTIPDEVAFIRLTFSKRNQYVYQAEWDEITKFSSYFEPRHLIKPQVIGTDVIYKLHLNTILSETIYSLTDFPNKKNDVISFFAELGEDGFGDLKIGHGYNVLYGSYITINDTEISLYEGNAKLVISANHGLTIDKFISVTLARHQNNQASIIVTTASGNCSVNWQMQACNGEVFFISSYMAKNVDFSVKFCDFDCNVYMFGDSYTTIGDGARYPKYLLENGYTNMLMVGYGGISSKSMIPILKKTLSIATPKYLVWTLGMNDGSDSETYPDGWKNGIDAVIELCEKNNIVPILATIPCVPTIDHTKKNDYIKSVGCRYIDFAKAVGAESAGSTWYDGMLYVDNVHPDVLGAKALASRFMVDVPEAYKS